ncbi:MAG: tetratricopeptide repeat protein [Thermoanaerobaculia bacterium]
MKPALRAFAAAAALLVGGCASSAHDAHLANLRSEIRDRGLDPASIVILRDLSRDEELARQGRSQEPQHRDPAELAPAGGPQPGRTGVPPSPATPTRRKVFAKGSANCLGFTQMFIALARELDLPVYFLRVSDLQSFEREGDLIVASAHITTALGPPSSRRILDFAERPVSAYRWVEAISDLTAVALYYSNRGAEELRDGHNEKGMEYLLIASQLDPELSESWVNLGVARRRTGDLAGAEEAYRRALEVDPGAITAYQNLAGLLRGQGRSIEAQELLALTDRSSNRNPFSYLALGDLALRLGRISEAERFYRRALRLGPEQAEAQAAMGNWALRAGKPREAEKFLRRAQRLDPANDRVDTLSRSLASVPPNG